MASYSTGHRRNGLGSWGRGRWVVLGLVLVAVVVVAIVLMTYLGGSSGGGGGY